VPGMSLTCTTLSPRSVFKNVDLPALGLPTTANGITLSSGKIELICPEEAFASQKVTILFLSCETQRPCFAATG